ncbi:AAA family ATPase [Nocardia amamiensis]|uniref:AAA family ATPase n=1 Tax=Nocardia amamiensis TaxID=404578 RepID=UPI0033E8CE67
MVIRGNSASGKSTTAAAVQRRFRRGICAVVSQDHVRRQMVRESDEAAGFSIELIGYIAERCLAQGLVVIVEGILDADRYGAMLERLAAAANQSLFYSFDLTFEETLVRHADRPQAATIAPSQMAQWYHGWQPLPFVEETRIDSSWSLDAITDRIHTDITAVRGGSPQIPL